MDVTVQDASGRILSPCTLERAEHLVANQEAHWLSHEPAAIQLCRVVPAPPTRPSPTHPLAGRRTLLHICCAPCATYTVRTLREAGADLTGYWYNPNVQPYSEHERRRSSLAGFAEQIALPMIWEPGYDLLAYLRGVCGHETFGERCQICYRLRLESTARAAAGGSFQAFATTLTISPYQDLSVIRRVGEELAERYGVVFYGENLRRGFAEHHRLAEQYNLYRQRYCGCLYSEWEALDQQASTRRGRPPADPQAGL